MKKILTLVLAFVIVTSIGSVIAFAVPEQQIQTYSFSEFNPRSVSNLSDYSVRYDLITGETTVRRLDKTDLPLVADESDGFQGIQPFGYDDYWALVSNPAVRPYSRICQIDMYDSNNRLTVGSGCMIRPGIVLTAAHNLSPVSGNTPVRAITRFGAKGGTQVAVATTTATAWEVNAEWAYNKNANYDYAVIDVPTTVSTSTGYFGYTVSVDSSTQYTLSGYPYDQVKYSGYYMYTDSGTLSSGIYDDDTSFRHYFDSCGGVSGAPIYDNATGRVIGIHTWGHGTDVQGGTATKITTDVVALINSHI